MTYDDWKCRAPEDDDPQEYQRCYECNPQQSCCEAHMTRAEIEEEKAVRRFEQMHDEGEI